VRIISATNAHLETMVGNHEFRQDLLFRLNSIEIHIPPLRERLADIPVLANNFLSKHSQKYQRNIARISSSAMDKLVGYQWPGNIRELDHLIERAVLMASGDELQTDDLLIKTNMANDNITEQSNASQNSVNDDDWAQLSMEEAEGKLIALVMRRFHGNAKEAAKSLGYSKSSFYRRLDKFGL